LMLSEDSDSFPMIEVRSPELRKQMNLASDRRHFALKELLNANLEGLATPLLQKQKSNKRSLTELENKTIEAYEQAILFQNLRSGGLIVEAMYPPGADGMHAQSMPTGPIMDEFKALMGGVSSHNPDEYQRHSAQLQQLLLNQKWPEGISSNVGNIDKELFYNTYKPFRWACWLFFLMAVLMLAPKAADKINAKILPAVLFIPIVFLILGFYIRVSITGFAPVTNMYGTMIWVSLGVATFGWLFYLLYRNRVFLALTFSGAFVLLFLTDQIPLVISPDMDPIVAVLRSNLWLTIHVLTITISYAAFSIAMLLGNTMIIRDLMGLNSAEWIKTYSHFCYRTMQLGVFLLSIGIILGGVWADYSWGRFWGWDPKETWALIADLGFLILLHARHIGWVDSYRLLLLAPLSYLLVIMAWYGVNFILATGLHSYGFSSGGAMIVFVFVSAQLVLIGAALAKKFVLAKRS